MQFCCDTMERHSPRLYHQPSGTYKLDGETLRYCPWCGSRLEAAGPGIETAAGGTASTATLPAGEYAAYVDGACANNQAAGMQRGGWAAVFRDGRQFSGGDPATTNNRMELRAAIEALKNTPPGSAVTIYSDSAYVVNAFLQNWFRGWDARGWRNVKGDPVENQDLWKQLRAETARRRVTWIKVKGHAGNEWNEQADRLAVAAIPKP